MCIVEAKKDDMDQGLAQDLMGLEDLHGLNNVIGVVANFNEWIFAQSMWSWCTGI
jgi:hypothetical protein